MDRGQCHAALCVAMRIALACVRWALVLRRNVSVSRIFSSALRRPKAVLLEEMLLEGVNGTYEADGKLSGDIHNILSRDKGDCLLCLFDDVSTIAVRSNCCRRSDCIDLLSDAADVPVYNGCLSPCIISEGDAQYSSDEMCRPGLRKR